MWTLTLLSLSQADYGFWCLFEITIAQKRWFATVTNLLSPVLAPALNHLWYLAKWPWKKDVDPWSSASPFVIKHGFDCLLVYCASSVNWKGHRIGTTSALLSMNTGWTLSHERSSICELTWALAAFAQKLSHTQWRWVLLLSSQPDIPGPGRAKDSKTQMHLWIKVYPVISSADLLQSLSLVPSSDVSSSTTKLFVQNPLWWPWISPTHSKSASVCTNANVLLLVDHCPWWYIRKRNCRFG